MLEEAIPQYFQYYLGPPDARVKNWFLLNSPKCLILIMTLYFSAVIGCKKLMKERKPMKLYSLLVLYNSFQILFSGYIFKEVLVSAYLGNYKLSCSPLDASTTAVPMRMANALWLFYISKITDVADTIFFVLRKKGSQLSFLHCYHHASMIFNWYLGVLYLPGGQAFFSVLMNSMVHVIMYTYYLLSALGPRFKKYLWWKKYLTQLQLGQFFLVIGHIAWGLVNECKAPTWLAYFTMTYLSSLVLLFLNFYVHAYDEKVGTVRRKTGRRIDFKAGGDWKHK